MRSQTTELSAPLPKEKAVLQLVLNVEYETGNTGIEHLTERLRHMVERALDSDQLTQGSPARVKRMRYTVHKLPKLPPACVARGGWTRA